ncbi:Scytalone dehydratase [Aspergillus fruticulosus]
MTPQPMFEDITGCQAALFEWAESYDSKDWDRLKQCIAPFLRIDYRAFLNKLWENMPADEFVAMVSHPHFLGNPLLKTQHFVGTTRWEKVDDSKIIGHHQMRVAHQKHLDVEMKKVVTKCHGHGSAMVTYRKINGEWKFAGIEPNTRWTEFEGEGIFGHPEGEENEVMSASDSPLVRHRD